MDKKRSRDNSSIFVNKSIIASFVMLILIALCSYFYNSRARALNQNDCFSILSSSSADAAQNIESSLQGGLNSMKIIARMIEKSESLEPDKVAFILSAYSTNSVSTNIGVITSDNVIITSDGNTRSAAGIMNFGKEAATGQHLCERTTPVYSSDNKILSGFIPIVINGKVSAILFNEINIDAAAKQWAPDMYGGKAEYIIIDCDTGNVMLSNSDTVSRNISETGNEHLISEVLNRKNGYTSFQIKDELEFACYVPMKVANWEVVFFVDSETTLASSIRMRKNFRMFLIEEGMVFLLFMIWIFRSNKISIKDTEEEANSDALTELPNRNMFEAYCKEKKNNTNDLACIYIDVNGLHEINNSQGHNAGDNMLRYIADTLRVAFTDAEIFRTGGDEFVIFQEKGSGTGINLKIRAVKEQLKDKNYYISTGISFGQENSDIESIVKYAERKMFDNKKAYYAKLGKEVRNAIHMPTEIDDKDDE